MPLTAEALLAVGEGAPSVEEKLRYLYDVRRHSEEAATQLDRYVIEQLAQTRAGLIEARKHQENLELILGKLTATPWHPAVFLHAVDTSLGSRAVVVCGGAQRIVGLAEDVALDSLATGDEVFLSNEMNAVMCRSPYGMPCSGEIALFERWMPDRRAVLRSRDEQLLVEAAQALREANVQIGDLVRFDRRAWIAFERIEPAEGQEHLLNEVPAAGRQMVGGQEANLDVLLSALTAILIAPAKAALYGLDGRQSILMVGPPGCGKTLMARVAAAEITRLSGKRCRCAVVKPGSFETPWVGETQQNIRSFFKALREAAHQDQYCLCFFDEIESVGRTRGNAVGYHSDKFLAAFLAELDGFADRSNVAIISATNRKDLLDPALLERLSDIEIPVERPDMQGARAIFEIHLPPTLPYRSNGVSAGAVRREIIETAVSRFYSPNGGNEVCVLRFRDGKTRTVAARELASGRTFRQICRAVQQGAFSRDIRGGEAGITATDMEEAVVKAITRIAGALTPRNIYSYLADLPQDVDCVSVEPVRRRVAHRYQYLNVA
jgi:proteasome-associated ATPase